MYNGRDEILGIGPLWFISTIVQFYIMTPIIYCLVKNLNKNKSIIIFILTILTGGGIRLLERYFGLDWYIYTYTLSLSNIDIFLCGVLLNKFTNTPDNNLKKHLRPIGFLALLFIIIFIAYDWLGIDMAIYNCFEYYFPSVYIIVTGCIIYAFDYSDKEKIESLSFNEIKRYPIRIFEALGSISFSFYLFHSNIIVSVIKLFPNANHLEFIFYAFTLSLILSVIISTFMYFTIEKYFNKFKK